MSLILKTVARQEGINVPDFVMEQASCTVFDGAYGNAIDFLLHKTASTNLLFVHVKNDA